VAARLLHRFSVQPVADTPKPLPWSDEAWNADMGTNDLSDIPDPQLRAECEDYASRRAIDGTSETKEELHRITEENTAGVKNFRWEKQDELKIFRPGRILNAREFLRLLNRIVPARFWGISKYGLIGLQIYKPNESGDWHFVCGVQGTMTEYSQMYFDAHNLPTSEKYRGWRTVLLRLITGGFISEEAAHRVFGEPVGSEQSRRYREQLYAYRNR
jgi:hypothetical protein